MESDEVLQADLVEQQDSSALEEKEDAAAPESLQSDLRNFADEKFVQALIENIPQICQDPVQLEWHTYKLKDILDHYQEQPQLIDAYLGKWTTDLIRYVKAYAEGMDENDRKAADLSLTVLRLLTKLRGYKVIIKYLPHQVSDVELSLGLIEYFQKSIPKESKEFWEQQYVLLLWLSIALQIPFDLCKLTDAADRGTERSIESRILRVCKGFITEPGKLQDAAAYLLSRFVTRPDSLAHHGKNVIDYLLIQIFEAKERLSVDSVLTPHVIVGCLSAFVEIFKSGTRTHLLPLAEYCLPRLIELDLLSLEFSSVRKHTIKALQRLALIYLPTRLPSWRYKRGFRSLEDNIAVGGAKRGAGDAGTVVVQNGVGGVENEEEVEVEVSEWVEQITGFLLQGLNDNDGLIRWSAAKGVGRICERLPQSFSEDVQNGVLQLFSYERAHSAWHGGCLALAELARRGALLPSRFHDVVPVVLKALLYEELRGTFAVGSEVRDAACYVCWAFARAYEPKDLAEFVGDIAQHLVLVALFDRSVNCRRAASAAFQEHVGRQGSFPRGLDIIGILDFESLGRRSNTYLKLSQAVAQYPEYSGVILDFLVAHRLGHWDASVRELAAQALLLLTPVAPNYVAKTLMGQVVERVGSSHLFIRHGAVIGLGCLCEGLHKSGYFDEELADQVETVLLQMKNRDVFRGLGHELFRQAVLNLILRVSKAELPFHAKRTLLEHMAQLVESNLSLENVKVQEQAVATLEAFLLTYGLCSDASSSNTTLQQRCLEVLRRNLTSPSEVLRRSSVLALASLPPSFMDGNLGIIVETIVKTCPRSTHPEPQWVDCRRNCCRAIARVIERVPMHCFSDEMVGSILDFLGECLSDYTEDKRGNIGRIVRLAGIETARSVFDKVVRNSSQVLTSQRMEVLVQNMVRLFGEGIPDIRSAAGQTLWRICISSDMGNLSCKDQLATIFPKHHRQASILWLSGSATYPIVMDFLRVESIQSFAMLGLISSLGSMTESTIRESTGAFRKFAKELSSDPTALIALAQLVARTVRTAIKQERLALACLHSLKQILATGVFYGTVESDSLEIIVELLDTVQHIRLSQSSPKVIALVEVYAEALQFSETVRRIALERLLPFLSHVYPRVRIVAATKLHESLIICDELVPEEDVEMVSEILSTVRWQFSLEESQKGLGQLCDLLKVDVKPLKLKSKGKINIREENKVVFASF